MSIQRNQYVVEQGVAAVTLNAERTVIGRVEKGDGSKPHEITPNASDASANARRDSYVAGGAYGFLAMKL